MTWVAGTGCRPRAAQTWASTAGIDVGVGADGARELAHGDRRRGPARMRRRSRSACRAHRANLAPKVVGSACMPWVRPVTGTSISSRARAAQGVDEAVEVGQEQIGGPGQRGAQRGVHHVGRGQPVVDVRAGGRADAVLDHVDEGGHVVIGDLLPLEHVGHEDVVDRRRLGPAGRRVLGRHHADARPAPRWPAARPRARGRSGRRR